VRAIDGVWVVTKAWAILSGEYPPAGGGVADHARLVALELSRAGDDVHVFSSTGAAGQGVHVLKGGFGPSGLHELGARLNSLPATTEILVQYAPNAFGWRGMNLPFCWWLDRRASPKTIVFHEVMYPVAPGQPIRHNLLGHVHRKMARLLVRDATRAIVTTPRWETILRNECSATCPIEFCPVPSNLPTTADPHRVAAVRRAVNPDGGLLVGHFGTYGRLIADMLLPLTQKLAVSLPDCRFLLVGRGSGRFAAVAPHVVVREGLDPQSLAEHLAACDLLVQPYPDGVTCRRSTLMAGLALGVPTVTNWGDLSEDLWRDTDGIALAPSPNVDDIARCTERLAEDEARRQALRVESRRLYAARFSIEHTIACLRRSAGT
jgi:glycosyltransferase involved in cell wall biosynthesis